LLLAGERQVLKRLLGDAALLGIAGLLLPDRAEALKERARQMLARDEVLRAGEF
jgi:hypothetical protein